MSRPIPWFWIVAGGLLLVAPGTIGRLLLGVAESLTFVVVVLPLLLGGAALVGWQLLKRRLRTCQSCGTSSFATEVCPACGTLFELDPSAAPNFVATPDFDASNVTINVQAVDVSKPDPK